MMKKIAIPTREDMVDDHFGHCAYYTVVTLDEQNQIVNKERLDSPEGCGCKSNIASVMQEMGITLMLAGNMGMGAYNKLSAHGVTTNDSHLPLMADTSIAFCLINSSIRRLFPIVPHVYLIKMSSQ